ncbi:MAG: peptidase domain-containing ABC transporter [Geminicoccaceae bacterium]
MSRLLRQFDRTVTEEELRSASGLGNGVADSGTLIGLAASFGFAGRLDKLTSRRLARLPTPFLAIGRLPGLAWIVRARSGSTYLVVEAVSGNTAAYTAQNLLALCDAALVLASAPTAQPVGDWRRAVLLRVGAVRWQIILASVLINLLALATPLFMMAVYNKVIGHAALRTLDVMAIGMVTLFGFELLLRSVRGTVMAHTGARLEAAFGTQVVRHLMRLPFASIDRESPTAVLERIRQTDQLRRFLTGQLPLLLVDLAFVGLFLVALVAIAPPLALVTALAMPLFVILSILSQRRQSALSREAGAAAVGKNGALAEAVVQIQTVKMLGLEGEMEQRYEQRLVPAAWAGFLAGRIDHVAGGLAQALQSLTALILIYVGARLIIAGELSVGALVAASILSARALTPLRQIAGAWTQIQQARTAYGQIDGFMAEPGERTDSRQSDFKLRGRIRFDAVSFTYPGAKTTALDGLSFDIAPGTTLGVVGPAGSGKSTLVRLILGLDSPSAGRVLLDDLPLEGLSREELRRQIGVVPQEVQLFSGTIAENIALGAADGSFPRVVAAAKFSGAHDFIRNMPDGYETRLGERGAGISMGQRQLIAIARALVRNPRILVMDEATSALSPAAEAYLLGNLRRASRGRTLILVTHRPAVLAICDRGLLIEGGRLAKSGTAAEIAATMQVMRRSAGLHAVS